MLILFSISPFLPSSVQVCFRCHENFFFALVKITVPSNEKFSEKSTVFCICDYKILLCIGCCYGINFFLLFFNILPICFSNYQSIRNTDITLTIDNHLNSEALHRQMWDSFILNISYYKINLGSKLTLRYYITYCCWF